jgi:hypothetical protein
MLYRKKVKLVRFQLYIISQPLPSGLSASYFSAYIPSQLGSKAKEGGKREIEVDFAKKMLKTALNLPSFDRINF